MRVNINIALMRINVLTDNNEYENDDNEEGIKLVLPVWAITIWIKLKINLSDISFIFLDFLSLNRYIHYLNKT